MDFLSIATLIMLLLTVHMKQLMFIHSVHMKQLIHSVHMKQLSNAL